MWRSDTALAVTLSTTTGFVVLILGFAFHWQSTRAREADLIHETVRRRVDTALNRGRCGLWDWDLARGRMFWSHSMFAILGQEPRDKLLDFGEVNALVHPDDVSLYELATQIAEGKTQSIDRAFRMRHAAGHWVWLRARCEITRQPDDTGTHLIGIAVDVTEQKAMAEQTAAADVRLRDAIETIPEAFVLWDADNRLVLCNSNFQELHNLPDEAIAAGMPYDEIVAAGAQAAGAQPVGNEHAAGEIASDPGARTFEAQLDDGRWLHISERRTKDGGYVSVGTDITTIKRHEDTPDRQRAAPDRDHRRPAHIPAGAGDPGPAARRPRREIRRGEDPRRGGQPGQVEVPRQYEPRAAHAAQRHHRLLRDHGSRHVRPARAPPNTTNTAATSARSGQFLLEVINDVLDMSKIEAGRIKLDFEEVEIEQVARRCGARRLRPRPGEAARAGRATSRPASGCGRTSAPSSRSRSTCCRTR